MGLPSISSLLGDKSNETISQVPQISVLLRNDTSTLVSRSNSNAPRASPLPRLSLNTSMPNFIYSDLETATNYFDKTPYRNCQHAKGRFLGSGAFGSVYSGLNIIDKPIVVKRLYLDNVDIVKIDNPVTKQFRNEVEILSKYRHENLVSLVGYSCDGPTYCLLYDLYVTGGISRGEVSVKLDTFSFGVVLLELITGLEPINEHREGCDLVTHVEEICEEDSIAPLIDLKAGSWFAKHINFAEELYRIAVKCLETKRRKQPTVVEIMAKLIELVSEV
ncbi:hypothetical protein ILUMI_25540 [Ignelater luminosus]|uniref:Protein kinase domain-containing protein n=1 Tax=Ignelater luminosus TaxID=2038154 RepID=A0A8K0C8C3_IGNLU|nr:hypothetical protein ILUMI_25540 [Ignelater luminosus]